MENVYYNPVRDLLHVGSETVVTLMRTTVDKVTKEDLNLLKTMNLDRDIKKAKPKDTLIVKIVLDKNWVKIGVL